MAPQSIDAAVLASAHPHITRRMSVSALISSGALILFGLITFIVASIMADGATALTLGLVVLGVFLVSLGIFRLLYRSKEIVYTPTGSVAKEKTLFFDLKHLGVLKNFVETGKFALDPAVKSDTSGNIRMDILISQDKNFAAVQLYQFVPYTYNPVTKIHYFTSTEVAILSSFLAGNNQSVDKR